MWIEAQAKNGGDMYCGHTIVRHKGSNEVDVVTSSGGTTVAYYKSAENLSRAWDMMRAAMAEGKTHFQFPSDEMLELAAQWADDPDDRYCPECGTKMRISGMGGFIGLPRARAYKCLGCSYEELVLIKKTRKDGGRTDG